MLERDDNFLLREYVSGGSEEAFATLVTRHINLVYSVAWRYTRNAHHAEEITQAVFVILARKAGQLRQHAVLSGWLYETSRLTAVTQVRSEIRRAHREREAHMQNLPNENESGVWPQIAPLLDLAMAGLNKPDRDAVVLRFFDGRSMTEVGAALGTSEEAAKKRVGRAVEKLRGFFKKRGVVLSAAVLAAALSANSIQAAPAMLAKAVTVVAIAQGATASGSTLALIKGALKIMAWTKIKAAIVSIAVVGLATVSVVQHQAEAKLHDENQALQQQKSQVEAGNEELAKQVAQAQAVALDEQNELAGVRSEVSKLRGEVTGLRRDAAELAKLKTELASQAASTAKAASGSGADPGTQLQQQLAQMPDKSIPELQLLEGSKWTEDASRQDLSTDSGVRQALGNLRRAAKIRFVPSMESALTSYANANNGQLPTDVSQLAAYFNPPVDATVLQRYQMLQTGNVSDLPAGASVAGEKAPVDDEYDTLFQVGLTGFTMQGVGKWDTRGTGK